MNESRDFAGRNEAGEAGAPNDAVLPGGCSWVRCQLPRFVDGELTELVTSEISAHLAVCSPCQEALEESVAETVEAVEQLVDAEPSADLAGRIASELRSSEVTIAAPRLWIPSAAAAALLLTTGLLAWVLSTPLDFGRPGEEDEVAHQTQPVISTPDSSSTDSKASTAKAATNAEAGSGSDSMNGAESSEEAATVALPPQATEADTTDPRTDSIVASTRFEDDYTSGAAAGACDAGQPSSVVRGDIDADGVFTQQDVLLLSAALEKGPDTVRCAAAADFDGDDRLTPRDVGDALFALNLKGSAPCFELREGSSLACDLAMCP